MASKFINVLLILSAAIFTSKIYASNTRCIAALVAVVDAGSEHLGTAKLPYGITGEHISKLVSRLHANDSVLQDAEVVVMYGSRTNNNGFGHPPSRESDLDFQTFFTEEAIKTRVKTQTTQEGSSTLAWLKFEFEKIAKDTGIPFNQNKPVQEFFGAFKRSDTLFSTATVAEERSLWKDILETADQENKSDEWVRQTFRRRPIYSKGALVLIRQESPRAKEIEALLISRDYTNILFF